MTSSFEFQAQPARLSDAERDRALKALRDGAAVGRLSHDTFLHRMELALAARRSEELAALTADLPKENRVSRAVFGAVEAVSGFTVRLRRAWQAERLPKLLLPHPGSDHPPEDRPRPRQRAAAEPRDGLPHARRTQPAGAACGYCATSAPPTGPPSTAAASSAPPSSARATRSASAASPTGSPPTEPRHRVSPPAAVLT
ncbi:hypothetical protein GCM10020256_14120 [Streptomyces thermocoprophilus]